MEKLIIDGVFRKDFSDWIERDVNYGYTLDIVLTFETSYINETIMKFLNNDSFKTSFTGNFTDNRVINKIIQEYNNKH